LRHDVRLVFCLAVEPGAFGILLKNFENRAGIAVSFHDGKRQVPNRARQSMVR